MKRTFHGGEFLYFLIHGGGIVLADGFRYLENLHGHRPGAHGNLDFVPDLYVVTSLDHAAVDADAAVVAGFVGHRPALRDLPDREREIVLMRFGLEGRRELTQKEVAQKMGISQSYISRLEKRIMLRLKKEFLRQTSCA